ncbi:MULTISPECIES: CPBP family intramembrane glutamic endopeptidase [Lactiplantibacillus]|uniref:CPBP family intramembrane glutamic endopeptidase n=1 Tax=Lactiplantibacillus TaxID=2767842 RepID=UPI002077566F|nr:MULTISPECIES: type II CAAX endopeptidase family protein [Lactiplantibacillus]MCM8608057.1 CPBP family intramembrane metalloprotease [Lactiplantibacillus sp. B652]
MELVDRGLGWLARVLLTIGLVIGVVIPPMLLRLINQLNRQSRTANLEIILAVVYVLVFGIVILAANALMRHYTGAYQPQRMTRHDWHIVLGVYAVILVLESLFQLLNQLIYHQSQTQNNAAIQNLMAGSTLSLWLMALSAVFLTPITEELVFRGVLMNAFFKQSWLKIILSGIVFGSLHSSSTLPSFMIYLTMGLTLASVYQMTGKIHASMSLHFIINALAMSLLLMH